MRLKSETGQSSVFAALLASVLVMLIAMTTNVGKLVTEKIAMQNTVDMAAYSGAATQAAYLNKMREINEGIWKEIRGLRETLQMSSVPANPLTHASGRGSGAPGNRKARASVPIGGVDGPTCAIQAQDPKGLYAMGAEKLIDTTQDAINAEYQTFLQLANAADGAATAAAEESASLNYQGTQSKLRYYHTARISDIYAQSPVLVSYKAWCLQTPPGTPVLADFTFRQPPLDTWAFKQKKLGDIQFAVGIVDAHPMSSFMSSYFDSMDGCHMGGSPNNMERCPLDVYAVAMPYYGKVGADPNGKDGRGQKQNKRNFNKDNPVMPEDPGDLDPEEVQNGPYKDYKVRFIGIFDDQLNYTDDSNQTEQRMPSVILNRIRH